MVASVPRKIKRFGGDQTACLFLHNTATNSKTLYVFYVTPILSPLNIAVQGNFLQHLNCVGLNGCWLNLMSFLKKKQKYKINSLQTLAKNVELVSSSIAQFPFALQ